MPDCCDPNGLGGFFGEGRAAADGRRYRSRGPNADERRVVGFLTDRGVRGMTVLEVGGGIGAMQIEILAAGAASAVNVEASPHYEATARELAEARGMGERIDRLLGDFATAAPSVPSADVVILHKVICCYHDMPALLLPAAAHARRWLVLTFPADRWWIRLGLRVVNGLQTRFGSRFRLFFHEPRAIRRIAEAEGLRVVESRAGPLWQFLALERLPT